MNTNVNPGVGISTPTTITVYVTGETSSQTQFAGPCLLADPVLLPSCVAVSAAFVRACWVVTAAWL